MVGNGAVLATVFASAHVSLFEYMNTLPKNGALKD